MPLFRALARTDHWRVTLRRGRGNSLDVDGLAQLEEFFGARGDDPRGVVLTHEGRSFCTGLDLDAVMGLDRAKMGQFMEAFHRALRAVFACPVPVVAALRGHAMAGGGLLALCADARILALGPAKIGVHGVQLGIAYPDVAVEILRHQLVRPAFERALYTGRLLDDRQSLQAGWVDVLVDPADLDRASLSRLLEFGRGGGVAFAANKLQSRRTALERLRRFDHEANERWLDQWFADSTRAAIRVRGSNIRKEEGSR